LKVSDQPARCDEKGIAVRPLAGLDAPGRLRHVAKERDREHDPPHRHAGQARAHRHFASGQPEPGRLAHHEDVDREEHAAADVADRVAGRRYAIELVLGHEMRQQRLVEDDGAGDADVADHEQHEGEQPVAA